MTVSIVVLTFNRRAELIRTLQGLAALPGRHPIVVVDNGSSDGTVPAVLAHFPAATLVRAGGNLGAAGRNLGVDAVLTKYVAFCDDDTCWESGALERAALILDKEPEIGVLAARILVGPEKRPDPACRAMRDSPLPGVAGVGPGLLGFMAGACIMRTDVFRAAGGYWAPFFIGGEEGLLALDIADSGWRIVYCPDIVTRHFPSPHRDTPRRIRLLARNAVWTAWMRLPPRQAWQATVREFGAQRSAAERWALFRDAVAGLPRALARRRCVSTELMELHQAIANANANARIPGE